MIDFEIKMKDSTGEMKLLIWVTEVDFNGRQMIDFNINIDTENELMSTLNEEDKKTYWDFVLALNALIGKQLYPIDIEVIRTLLFKICDKFGLYLYDGVGTNKGNAIKDIANTSPFARALSNLQNDSSINQHIMRKNDKKIITFNDIVGMEEVKEKLNDVIDQFNNKEKYQEWDIDPIQGILLYGPSGTGKSFISEALANEIDAKFIKLSAGDIMSKYIGESGKNIKRTFEDARKYEGIAIIYMDEIDFVASKRSDDENKERNATLNELLVQMASPDNDNIFMIFATNMIELLDPAFLRSGRCDFKIEVPLPDFESRKGMLELYSKNRPIHEDVDFGKIARNMSGMNCADVKHIANESARRALKAKKDYVEQVDFDETFEEMICGSSSKTKKLDEKDKEIVSIHEAGHLIANEVYKVNKTKKISILPRGSALGYVLHANEDENDKYLYTKDELMNRIKVCLAGRVAEELVFGSITTGASNDLEQANDIAMNYICKYGFTEDNGLVVLNRNDLIAKNKVSRLVKSLLEDAYKDTMYMLEDNKDILFAISEALKEKEELSGEEVEKILGQFNINTGALC